MVSITKFTNKRKKLGEFQEEGNEMFKYILDKRILRVLFEGRIFQLRDIQKEAIREGLFFRHSFLVCAPSGSGKTLIGEVCAVNNIFQNYGKTIYLVPFKALATEKFKHLKESYKRFKIKVELSIGDFEVKDAKLEKADIIVTTYEKCDSFLRNFHDKDWIFNVSTIIIDEIHIIGESSRGPRLESLIVRLNEFLHKPQIIGLSATIANAEFFNSWMTSLGNKTFLIKSDARPVPLHYNIEITQNRDSTIKRMVRKTLEQKGQVLIFVSTRRGTQQTARIIKNIVEKYLEDNELKICKSLEKRLNSMRGGNRELRVTIKSGVAFHHAGLLPKERRIIEDNYKKRIIKVICCTTTLSAGLNTPARVVILKDFKKYTTSGHNIKNFSGYFENGDGFSYFKPFSANEVFQMLGRAGRPGLDSVGYGIILVKNIEEKMWVEDHFFQVQPLQGILLPKYNDLISGLNRLNTLKEQVLLRVYEGKKVTMNKLISFFEKTYFWYGIKNKMKKQDIPVEQMLMINEITPINILKLHSDAKKVKNLKENGYQVKLTNFNDSNITGAIKTSYGVYTCQFDIECGIKCSCGFKNGISDNFINDKFSFEFCDHVTSFLLYLIELPDANFQKYTDSIIPKSIKNQYVLSYLFEKGLLIKNDDGTIKCSQFGSLIIRLYIYPVTGVMIRYKLENIELETFQDLMKEAYNILKLEGRVRDLKMLEPILEFADEEPLEQILDRYKIMAGDLFSIKENLERIILFMGKIAQDLNTNGFDLEEKLRNVSEMAETLVIRLHHGIREDLFDLVQRLDKVGRVRARILYNAGYHTADSVKKENSYTLNKKTGLGLNLCKSLIKK